MNEPLVQAVPAAPDPRELFDQTASAKWPVWFDTAAGDGASERYRFLACDPFRVLRGAGGRSEWLVPGGSEVGIEDPVTELEAALQRWRTPRRVGLPPFCGGVAGYFGYELAGDLESVPAAAYRDVALPDIEVGLYDLVIGWDLRNGECWIASTGFPHTGDAATDWAKRRASLAEAWLAGGSPPDEHDLGHASNVTVTPTERPSTFAVPGTLVRSTFSPDGYRRAVRRAIEFIRAGDVYQVNLSQRFEAPAGSDLPGLYRRLRAANPAPFGSYFRTRECAVLSTSPERYLRVTPLGEVETRPIKGTRPRDHDPVRDATLAAQLEASVKDRAENLMIADLLRNDLSRVCDPGSVRATDLFRVQSYATVHHLVSTVTGRLRSGVSRVDLLRASFPSGSVTGAPKIRAMEIIAELEPVARGPYCGAVGYMGFGGDMDSSVSIRIAVVSGGRVVFHAGGGVVADSNPEAEYEETLDKARALMASIGEAPT